MADSNSIFYKIGQATKTNVANAISGLLSGNNTWTGTNDFNKAVTVGTDGESADLSVKGGVSSTGAVSGNTVSATGAVSGGSVSATGAVSGATLSTTGNATIGGKATINGDLVVKGTTTTLSTSTLEVDDNFIHLSKGANDGAYSKDSGLYFERASGSDATAFIWDEDKGRFVLGELSAAPGGEGATTSGSLAFTGVGAQIQDAGDGGVTVDATITGSLGFTSGFGNGGSATTPGGFYVYSGSPDGKNIQVGKDSVQFNGFNETGYVLMVGMDEGPTGQGSEPTATQYELVLIVQDGDTLANAIDSDGKPKLWLYDNVYGGFTVSNNPNAEDYVFSMNSLSGGHPFRDNLAITSSEDSAVGADIPAVNFSSASPFTAQQTIQSEITFSAGAYDLSISLSGTLAEKVGTVAITSTPGMQGTLDGIGNYIRFKYEDGASEGEGTLTLPTDSSDPFTSFAEINTLADYFSYDAAYAANGGFYAVTGAPAETKIIEITYNSQPGANDYFSLTGSLSQPVSKTTTGGSGAVSGPNDDTVEVTPGKFLAGQVEIVDATDGVVALGDLADFNAGLNA